MKRIFLSHVSGKLFGIAACLLFSAPMVNAAGLTFSDGCVPAGVAPCEDVIPSLGTFRIAVAPAFQAILASMAFPGYDAVTHRLNSPILYDPSTVIGRSVPLIDGDATDIAGVAVGSGQTIVKDSSLTPPPGFGGGGLGAREVHTAIFNLNLKDPTGQVRVRAGASAPERPLSVGEVQSQRNRGRPQEDYPASSFFNVFVDVDIPGIGTLVNRTPLLVRNEALDALPPKLVYIHDNTSSTPLYFENDIPALGIHAGDLFGEFVLAGHGANFGAQQKSGGREPELDANGEFQGPDVTELRRKVGSLQEAPVTGGLNFIGSMPHLASAGFWETIFTLANTSANPAQARLSFFDDLGNALNLPLVFPTPAVTVPFTDRTLAGNGTLTLRSSGPDTQPVQVGSAQLAANGGVGGFVIFRYTAVNQEAVVLLETRDAPSYVLAYDNTGGVALGVAVESVSAQPLTVPVVVRDDAGSVLANSTVQLNGNGHTSFVMHTQFPATANKRGTVEFQRPAGGRISALGVRFTPPGTLTTIPALANVTSSGGSVAHIAAGSGWKTSVVLVNTGNSPANATVRFLDDNGNPLVLPLTFPQTGATDLAAQSTRSIAAGASFLIESTGLANTPVQVGSMQLTTDGNVGGYVIFRYQPNGQEASVQFEDRSSNTYVIPFDHTAYLVTPGNIATGTAVNNASALPVTIPVILRDEGGAQIGASSISLPANGHTSFVLGAQFPATLGIRGTVEFDRPSGANINVLGIRTPPTLTFTTLPPVTK